jgi:hypothetical protein
MCQNQKRIKLELYLSLDELLDISKYMKKKNMESVVVNSTSDVPPTSPGGTGNNSGNA